MTNKLQQWTKKILGKNWDISKAFNCEIRQYNLLCDIFNNKAYENRSELKQLFNNYIDKILNEKIPIDLNVYINKWEYGYWTATDDIKDKFEYIELNLTNILRTIETPKLFKDYSRRQFLTDLNYQLETNKNIYLDQLDKIYKI